MALCLRNLFSYQRAELVAYSILPTDLVSCLNDGFGNLIYAGSSLKNINILFLNYGWIIITSSTPLAEGDYLHPIYKYETKLT